MILVPREARDGALRWEQRFRAHGSGAWRPPVASRAGAYRSSFSDAWLRHARCGEPAAAAATAAASGFSQTRVAPRFERGISPLASSVEMTRAEQRLNHAPTGASWRPGMDRRTCRPSFNLVPTGASWRPGLDRHPCRPSFNLVPTGASWRMGMDRRTCRPLISLAAETRFGAPATKWISEGGGRGRGMATTHHGVTSAAQWATSPFGSATSKKKSHPNGWRSERKWRSRRDSNPRPPA
jgi:hypothetical protein